jgi:hypothetical protein
MWDAPESSNHTDAASREKESSWMCTAGKLANITIDRGSNSERLVNAVLAGAPISTPERESDPRLELQKAKGEVLSHPRPFGWQRAPTAR